MADIANPSGVQGAIEAAKRELDQASAALVQELSNPSTHGLEGVLVNLGEASRAISAAIIAAAGNVNR